jgi:hypothetical protein
VTQVGWGLAAQWHHPRFNYGRSSS